MPVNCDVKSLRIQFVTAKKRSHCPNISNSATPAHVITMRLSADRSSSKPRKPRVASSSSSPPIDARKTLHMTLLSSMARKSWLLKPAFLAVSFFLLLVYAFNSFSPAPIPDVRTGFPRPISPAKSALKIYMYDLPRRFTHGVIEQHLLARGGDPLADATALKYPGHQHMAEWYLFSDLLRPDPDRAGSPVSRVSDPDQAELFFVPFFSSLSLVVNPSRAVPGSASAYSDEEMQEALMEWLERQEYWKRNNGVDHVFIAQDPNALYKVVDRIKAATLIVSDFGRLRPDQGSLVKDIIVPYSHRIRFFEGEVGVENRRTLLFFMGNRYRKEGGKIRDMLFQVLENQEGVIIKHGAQSRESRRAASQGMHTSKFCLHPAGDTPSACRLFDAIVSMCVPVIVSDDIELPFEDVIDYRKIAIFVQSAAAVKPNFLLSLLRKISTKEILEYQRELKKVKRYFDYDNPHGTVNEIWRQVAQKDPLIKLMINRDKRLVKRELTEPDCFCRCSNQTGGIALL